MNKIRIAKIKDLESIVEIYNQAIKSRFETADTMEIKPEERFEWFNNHNPETYPIFIYELNNRVVGWISISPYRQGRQALRHTVEISYYIHTDFKRQGIGGKLIKYAIHKSKELNYKTIFAIILDKNEASINILKKFGFVLWGHLPNIADFSGIECGHVYYGLRIDNLN